MRLDDRWILGIILDFLPETADLIVNAAVEDIRCSPHGQIKELFPAEYQSRALDEDLEKAEFRGAERNSDAIIAEDFLATQIDLPMTDADYPAIENCVGRNGTCSATQHGSNPSKKLARIEWLHQVVIRPEFQADDTIRLFGHCGQKYDGYITSSTDLPAQRDAVFAGHHDIENDQVNRLPFEDSPQGRTTFRDADPVTVVLEILPNQIPNIIVIVYDDDMCGVLHSPTLHQKG